MNPDPQAIKVWERLLPEIRRKRRQRNALKLTAAACMSAAVWFTFTPTNSGVVATTAAIHQQQAPTPETLAVMRVGDDGIVRLEELRTDQLGPIELAFGLTPLVSSADLDLNADPAGLYFNQ